MEDILMKITTIAIIAALIFCTYSYCNAQSVTKEIEKNRNVEQTTSTVFYYSHMITYNNINKSNRASVKINRIMSAGACGCRR